MFENIQFQYLNFKHPTKSPKIETYLEDYEILNSITEFGSFYKTQKKDVDFSLEGDGKTFFPGPLSPSAKKSLLYLQVFGLNNAGPHHYTQRKNYDSYLLLYTYNGKGFLRYEDKEYELHSGCICLIDCRRPHFYSTTEAPWNHFILHFNGQNAEYLFEQFYRDNSVMFQTDRPNQLQNCIENVLRACQSNYRFYELKTSHLLEELIMEIIDEKYHNTQRIPDFILNLRNYMDHHFTEQLSLNELSEFTKISKYHLSREFKKYTGFTINEYLINSRLDRAKYLLSNTELSITQISQICGFVNYSNFYNLFLKNTGTIPTDFRKKGYSE